MTEATQTAEAPRRTRRVAIPAEREPARESVRPAGRTRIVVEGHGGEKLTRKRSATGDIFEFDRSIIPDGWDYQWNPYTVVGEMQHSSRIAMAENGWRPVPAERHPGIFMPNGHTGPIIRDGQILEERPMALSIEARQEEEYKAKVQMRDAKEGLGLSAKLPAGYSDDARYAGTGAQVKNSIERISDAPRPALPIADD